MAGMDVGGDSGGGRHKKKRKGKRIGVKMDMTPMVDIAFLLLTFFMLTTVFSRPQAMEINLPPPNETPTDVRESTVLTIRGGNDDMVYWSMGSDTPTRISYDGLRDVLGAQKQSLGEDLIAVIKLDRDATYDNFVDIQDDIKTSGLERFSIAEFTAQDSTAVLQSRAGGAPAVAN